MPIEFHATPSPFSSTSFAQSLETRQIGRQLRVFDSIGSTNQEALGLTDDEAVHGLVLLADEQTLGHGRFQRPWVAPAGKAVLMTVVLRGETFARFETALTMAASVAVHRLVGGLGIKDCEIRWPNDVLIRGRKVCGILVERGPWNRPGWVLGIGLNVNQRVEEFPPELRGIATSLSAEMNMVFVRENIAAKLCRELEDALEAVASGADGVAKLREQWQAASCLVGQSVAVDTGAEIVEGMAIGVEENGGLVVRQQNGLLKSVLSGTVVKG